MQVMAVIETQPERKAAPGRLELVRAFVNSVDYFDDEEDLPDPRALGRWLSERGLLDDGHVPTDEEFGRALDVREGLRAVLRACTSDTAQPAAWTAWPTELPSVSASPLSRASGPAQRVWTARWVSCWPWWPMPAPTGAGSG